MRKNTNPNLYFIGLVFIASFGSGYLLYLNSTLWNPFISFQGRTVEYEDVHKIGINYFIYQNESIPFTGCSVKRGSVAGAVVSKTCFRDGMIHHREIYEPDANAKVVEISFLNESVSKVAFWSPDGQFRESSAESVRINELIKELGYGHIYDDDPL